MRCCRCRWKLISYGISADIVFSTSSLSQDVAKVGHQGDTVEVARGFARNFLIPERLASPVPKGRGKVAAGDALAASSAPQREEVADDASVAMEAVKRLTSSPLVRLGHSVLPRPTLSIFSRSCVPSAQIIRAAVSRKTRKIAPISHKQLLEHVRWLNSLPPSCFAYVGCLEFSNLRVPLFCSDPGKEEG